MKINVSQQDINKLAAIPTNRDYLKGLSQSERKAAKAVYKHLISNSDAQLEIKVRKKNQDIIHSIITKLEAQNPKIEKSNIFKRIGKWIGNKFNRVSSKNLETLAKAAYLESDSAKNSDDSHKTTTRKPEKNLSQSVETFEEISNETEVPLYELFDSLETTSEESITETKTSLSEFFEDPDDISDITSENTPSFNTVEIENENIIQQESSFSISEEKASFSTTEQESSSDSLSAHIENLNQDITNVNSKYAELESNYPSLIAENFSKKLEDVNTLLQQLNTVSADNNLLDQSNIDNYSKIQQAADETIDELFIECKKLTEQIINDKKESLFEKINSHLPLFEEALNNNYLGSEFSTQVNGLLEKIQGLSIDQESLEDLESKEKEVEQISNQIIAIRDNSILELENSIQNQLDQLSKFQALFQKNTLLSEYVEHSSLNALDALKNEFINITSKETKSPQDFNDLQVSVNNLIHEYGQKSNEQTKLAKNTIATLREELNHYNSLIGKSIGNKALNASFPDQLESKKLDTLLKIQISLKENLSKAKKTYLQSQILSLKPENPEKKIVSNLTYQSKFFANLSKIPVFEEEINNILNIRSEITEILNSELFTRLKNEILTHLEEMNMEQIDENIRTVENLCAEQKSQIGNLLNQAQQMEVQLITNYSNYYKEALGISEMTTFIPYMNIYSFNDIENEYTKTINSISFTKENDLSISTSNPLSISTLTRLNDISKTTEEYINALDQAVFNNFQTFRHLSHSLERSWFCLYHLAEDIDRRLCPKDDIRNTGGWHYAKNIKIDSKNKIIDKVSAYRNHVYTVQEGLMQYINALSESNIEALLNNNKAIEKLENNTLPRQLKILEDSIPKISSQIERVEQEIQDRINIAIEDRSAEVQVELKFLQDDLKNIKQKKGHFALLSSQFETAKQEYAKVISESNSNKEKLLFKIYYEGLLERIFQNTMKSMSNAKVY